MESGVTLDNFEGDSLLFSALFVFEFATFALIGPKGKTFLVPGASFAPTLCRFFAGKVLRLGERRIGLAHDGVSRGEAAADVATARRVGRHGSKSRKRLLQHVKSRLRLARLDKDFSDSIVGKRDVRPRKRIIWID